MRVNLDESMTLKKLFFMFLLTPVLINCAHHIDDVVAYGLIVKEETPLNESGPYQTVPASVILRPGDRVRLVSKAGDHAYVETIEKTRGFVPQSVWQAQGDQ